MNPMKTIKLEKVTLNIGAGKDQAKLEKGMLLLKNITNISPVKTFTKKRIPDWGIRPGLPIGCKLTLRKKKALDLLKIKGLLNQPIIIDGRNIYDPDYMEKLGFMYQGVGR